MSQTERIYKIHRLLSARRAPSMETLVNRLEVARATIKRDLTYMKDRLDAPVYFDKVVGGYRYASDPERPPYELPGLWFTSEELHSLLLMKDLLTQLQSGLLGEPLKPVQKKLERLLELGGPKGRELRRRFRILGARTRPVQPRHFMTVSTATLERRRLDLVYFSRYKREELARTVSPQRLIYYDGNWYLDGWCHLREGLRSFSLDSIRSARVSETAAMDVEEAALDAHVGRGYGIYSGEPAAVAVLRFCAETARYVEGETWHERQQVTVLPDGGLRMTVPYADARELVMDLLRLGAGVEVEGPAELREAVRAAHVAAAEQYGAVRRQPGSAVRGS
jgi:predicted DNA-binding transcriptional regulator YafY